MIEGQEYRSVFCGIVDRSTAEIVSSCGVYITAVLVSILCGTQYYAAMYVVASALTSASVEVASASN